MTGMPLDRDLRDLFERGPARAPALTVAAAIATASALPQRRARFGRLDRRAWPPVARSASDPGVRRGVRLAVAALVVVAVAAAIAVGARLLDRPPSIRLDPAGSIDAVVLGPSAKLWPDGRILIEGQSGAHYLFDTATGTSERLTFGSGWSVATAHVLPDGRVLLTKRPDVASRTEASIDVAFFDPGTGQVTPAGSIATPWFGASALVLRDGRLLLSGGVVFRTDETGCDATVCEGSPTPRPSVPAAMTVGAKDVVRIFDPATGTTAEVGHLASTRFQHQAVELDDGRVLILGGGDDGADPTNGGEVVSVEVFDLRTGSSAVIGTLPPAHFPGLPRGTRLADGRILVLGGGVLEYPCGIPSAAPAGQPVEPPPTIAHELTYVFDPRSNRIAEGPLLPHFYAVDNAVPLAGGQALAFGYTNVPPPDCAPASRPATSPWLAVIDVDRGSVYESRDPFTGTATLDVDVNRVYGAGVALPDGRVALVGDDPEQDESNAIDVVTVGP